MEWLTPITGLLAATVAVPLLTLLYFLKLKRQMQTVSSTLLWQRAVQDLQVNAPFQRLRRNLLFLLQLLALLAVLTALAGPVWSRLSGGGRRLVLLIDRSASMNAQDAAGSVTRLARAKQQARLVVDSLRNQSVFSLHDRPDQAMIIAFDDHAQVLCNFTSDKRQLLRALDAIQSTDRGSSLHEALTVARAYSQAGQKSEAATRLELFSDGRISDAGGLTVDADELVFHRVGQSNDNVGLTVFQARRSLENPDHVAVFVQLANMAVRPVQCDVQMGLDGNVMAVRSVSLPSAQPGHPGTASLDMDLVCPGGGLLEVRQLHKDVLTADDRAWTVIQPPKSLHVALVTPGNFLLRSALVHCPLARLDVLAPADFNDTVALTHDVTVLDDCPVRTLPSGRYLIFGAPPADWKCTLRQPLENQRVADWRANHPLLKHVDLANLFVARAQGVDLPRAVQVLAQFNQGPAMGLWQQPDRSEVWVGFNCLESNWPFEPGFVIFCYNCLDVLGMQVTQAQGQQWTCGTSLVARGLPTDIEVTWTPPHGPAQTLHTDLSGRVRVPETQHVGLYHLKPAHGSARIYPVNLLNARESNIAPVMEVPFATGPVEAATGAVQRTNIPLWPWAVLFTLGLVLIEWWVYNGKLRI